MAKFKVGTTVREKGKRNIYDIVRAYVDRDGIQNYQLSGRNGSFDIEEEKLEKFFSPVTVGKDVGEFFGENANSCARNAIKVGDKVTYWVFDEKVKGTVKAIRGNKAEVVRGDEKAGLTIPLKDLEAWNSVRSTNAVVANALNACARNADGVPPDLWEKLKRTSLAYVVTGELKNGKSVDELIARFRKSGPGSQIPGRAQDSAIAASVLEEMKRRGINACGTARNAESPEDYDGNMHQVISSIAHDLEKTVLQLGKAVSLWEKADKSEYARGEAEKSLALDRRLYSLVTGALQYMRKAEQASA